MIVKLDEDNILLVKMSISRDKVRIILGLTIAVLIPVLFGNYINYSIKSFFYSFSITFKSILLFLLPFIIFSFVFSCLLSLKTNVIKLVLFLIVCIFISNFIGICTGFSVGLYFNNILGTSSHITFTESEKLSLLWNFQLPVIIQNEYALISGFLMGIIFSFYKFDKINQYAKKLNFLANYFLQKIFIPLLPLFILGLIFKLEHEKTLLSAFKAYGPYFFIIIGTQISYMLMLYYLAANCKISKAITYVKNILPATITGFATSSSAASLPMLILCSNRNVKPEMVETILPATINTHTLGSAIGISILTITTMHMFHLNIDFYTICQFILAYTLAKFAVAGVPGGVIVVIYPLLESILHFTPDMLGMMTAMYMLFDPFGTSANVTGNGAFIIMFDKLYSKFSRSY